jgi:raffinose/stachyose/melibiose transport system permease protein
MQKSLKKYFAVFALPTVLAFTVMYMVPLIMGVVLSFAKFRTVNNITEWVGFRNYINAFALNDDFLNALIFTVKFTIVSVITINLFAFILASLLTKDMRGTSLFRTIFFMPNLIGGIVLGYVWQFIINSILVKYQLTITSDPKFGFWGLVVLMNWQLVGYMMIIYIAGIQNIPEELTDTARVDGAGSFQVLRHITIPMLMPAITICLFLTLTNSFKLFDQNLALTAGAPSRKTAMLALDIFNTYYSRKGFEGVAQAKAVIFSILVSLIALAQLVITRRREVEH